MSAKIPLRTDYDAVQARALARKATDPNQVRRLLAIAAVYDDMNRRDAAAVGGMDRQRACATGCTGSIRQAPRACTTTNLPARFRS